MLKNDSYHHFNYYGNTSPPLTPIMVKSNTFHYHQPQQQRYHRNSLQLPVSRSSSFNSHHRLSRGAAPTMAPIFEKNGRLEKAVYYNNNRVKIVLPIDEKEAAGDSIPIQLSLDNNNHKKRHSSSLVRRSNSCNNNKNKNDDNIPLALLAYKKGYTTIYPSSSATMIQQEVQDFRTNNSYLSATTTMTNSGSEDDSSSSSNKEKMKHQQQRHQIEASIIKATTNKPISTMHINNKEAQHDGRKKSCHRSASTNSHQINRTASPPSPLLDFSPQQQNTKSITINNQGSVAIDKNHHDLDSKKEKKKKKKWYTALRKLIKS